MSPDLIGLAVVMRRLDVKRKAVMRLIQRGKLTASRVGRLWKFDPRDVDAYVEASKVRPAGEKADEPRRKAAKRFGRTPGVIATKAITPGDGTDRYL